MSSYSEEVVALTAELERVKEQWNQDIIGVSHKVNEFQQTIFDLERKLAGAALRINAAERAMGEHLKRVRDLTIENERLRERVRALEMPS